MACDSPNRYASISLELRAASVVLSLKFRRQIGVRPEFSDRTPANPRDIPDDMTLDSFEMVEDGIARVQIKHQIPAAVGLTASAKARTCLEIMGSTPCETEAFAMSD